jgi:hypothetical protein
LWRLSERKPDPSWPSWRLRLVEPNLDPLHQLADCPQVGALFNELLGQDPLRLREAVDLAGTLSRPGIAGGLLA